MLLHKKLNKIKQTLLFEHVPSPTFPPFIKYDGKALAWDFEGREWTLQQGCRRLWRVTGTQVKEALEALSEPGYILVVWDAFPWVIGLIWAPSPVWVDGCPEMISSSGKAWPELQEEFLTWI